MTDIIDVLIIGAGPAGYTAGIYSARANLKTVCLEGWQPGGWLTTTTMVENFPGFKDGILGPQLMGFMREQAARFGVEFVAKDAIKVDFSKRPFTVQTDEQTYLARSVIIATGSKARRLGLLSESKLWGKGVASCATCDGFFFRGKVVAVVGGGDTAMEEANFLTKFATTVHLLIRADKPNASAIMVDHAKANPKIQFQMNVSVEEVLGDNKVTGLKLKNLKTGELSELPLDGMFLAIGQIPSTDFLKNSGVELDQWGFVSKKEHTMTSVSGVFVAGDCADFRYKQGIVAAGAGAQASIDAKLWLEQNK